MPAKKTAAAESVETVELAPEATAELAAAEAEAADAELVVEHGGKTYVIPAPMDYPVDVVFADNDFEAVRLVLGEEQWQEYRRTRPTIRDFQQFHEKINLAAGN
ncbi:hypothetical protein [Streptomyces werraensis]|uniref:hypothetical protein n=1 Tax=Streptomyces werraensis TaxID=68284 RepID=UPI0036FF6E85